MNALAVRIAFGHSKDVAADVKNNCSYPRNTINNIKDWIQVTFTVNSILTTAFHLT